MTLNGVMAVTLRYFTEFGKPALQKTICGGIYARVYCILVRVQCRRKESSRSLSPDEFLFNICCECHKTFAENAESHKLIFCITIDLVCACSRDNFQSFRYNDISKEEYS